MTPTLPELELGKYSIGQRLELIEKIWDSIREEEFVVPESHKELVRQRIAHREANPGGDKSWEEVKREIQSEGRSNTGH